MTYVYLDLNIWIDLHMRGSDDEARKQIEKAVYNGEIIIPLIHTLLTEEASFENEEIRSEMFDYMYELSDSHSLRTYVDVRKFEIERFVQWICGQRDYDLVGRVRGRGVDHLYGDWKLTIDGEELDRDEHKELFNEIEREFKQQRGFEVTTGATEEYVRSQDDWEVELHDEIEKMNEQMREDFNDNNKRRRFIKYQYFYEHIFPLLALYFVQNNQSYDFSVYDFEKYINQGDEQVEQLFQLFPATNTYLELTNARDLQDGGKPNDIYDLFSLAVAIPYCDIVATERFWKREAVQAGLSDIYNTKIVSSIDELQHEFEDIVN